MCRPGERCCAPPPPILCQGNVRIFGIFDNLHMLPPLTGSGLRRKTFLIFGKHVSMFSLLAGEVRCCCELRWTELLCVAWCEQFPTANDMKWYDLVISVIISVNSTHFTQQPEHITYTDSQIDCNNIMSEQDSKQQEQFSHTAWTRTFQTFKLNKALD